MLEEALAVSRVLRFRKEDREDIPHFLVRHVRPVSGFFDEIDGGLQHFLDEVFNLFVTHFGEHQLAYH